MGRLHRLFVFFCFFFYQHLFLNFKILFLIEKLKIFCFFYLEKTMFFKEKAII